MVNHLTTPQLVAWKSAGMWGTQQSVGNTRMGSIIQKPLVEKSVTYHSRVNGQKWHLMTLTEHISSCVTAQTTHLYKAPSNISSHKKGNIGQAWPVDGGISWQSSTLKDYLTSHYLNSQNQFIGNEDTSWCICHVYILFSHSKALLKDLSPPLISFPFHMLANPR